MLQATIFFFYREPSEETREKSLGILMPRQLSSKLQFVFIKSGLGHGGTVQWVNCCCVNMKTSV